MEMIFEPNAEAIGHDDHRLVRKAHARCQRGPVATHQIRGFMDRQADAVPSAVRQAGQAIVGPKPRAFQHRARCGVDRFARHAGLDRGEGSGLCFLLQRPEYAHIVFDLPEGIGAGDVAVIAIDRAAGVDQDETVIFELLIAGQTVRKCGRTPELDGAESGTCRAQREPSPSRYSTR